MRPLREHQVRAIEMVRASILAGNRRSMVQLATGAGKCLGKGTPIIMADGTVKPVENIVPGDRLASPNGCPKTVASVTSGSEMMYRITPNKGDVWECNASHLLSIKMTKGFGSVKFADGQVVRESDDRIVTIRADDFFNSTKTAKHVSKLWRPEKVDFDGNGEPLEIPPYILGVWLGDGTLGAAEISKPFGSVTEAWCDYARNLGMKVTISDEDRCPKFHATNGRGKKNQILDALREIGVDKRKHIPSMYKTSSAEDRMELLAGIFDTDGSNSKTGVDFISKSEEFARDVAFVCGSLGLPAKVSQCEKSIKSIGFTGNYWRVSVSGDCSKLPFKRLRSVKRVQKKDSLVTGFKIEPIGLGTYYGFEIDGDRLFLLGDFTVTHNTRIAGEIVLGALRKGKRVAFTVPRIDLIDQTVESFVSDGIRDIGVIQADHPMTDHTKPVQVCSVQTLAHRQIPDVDLVIVDEAHEHHEIMTTWMAREDFAKVPFIGLSATPWSKGLGKHYQSLLVAATMKELIDRGYLSKFRVFAPSSPDLSGVKTVAGDYHEGQLSGAMSEAGLVADIVSTWCQKANGLPTLAFCVDRAHARLVQDQFLSVGIPWGYVDYKTSREGVREIGRKLRSGELMGVSNVDKLTTGVDWDIRAIINARPTKSEARYVQAIGRGLRIADGKDYLIILDHANATETLGFVTEIHHDAMSVAERLKTSASERKEILPKTCKACSFVYDSGPACPSCGHSHAKRCGVDVADGELYEINQAGERAKKKAMTMAEKARLYGELKAYASDRGHSDGWVANKYREKTGVWPNDPSIRYAPAVTPSAATISWIRSRNIAWAKRQGRAA